MILAATSSMCTAGHRKIDSEIYVTCVKNTSVEDQVVYESFRNRSRHEQL